VLTSHTRGRRLSALLALAAAVLALGAVSALASGPPQTKIGDFYFHPGKLTIQRGTKLKWKWVGFLEHNVSVKKGPAKFHSRTQLRGTYSHAFSRKGTYVLYCSVHPNLMKETIVVK
jgi:plastocyanin